MKDTELVVGISWFQPEQWERLIEISEDRDELEETYEEWRRTASKFIADMASEGRLIKKVHVDVEKYLHWCGENNLPVKGFSRSRYVSHLLKEKGGN